MDEDLAAQDVARLEPGEVDGGAAARRHPRHGLAVDLQPAHPDAPTRGEDLHLVARGEGAARDRARDHGAEAAQGEDAVDGQPQHAGVVARGRLASQGQERGAELGEPLARPGRHAQHGPPLEERALHELARFHLRQAHELGVGGVALGEDDEPAGDAEEAADVEVLAGLGHDRLVGRHHQHHRVDAVGPRQHVAHEALVAGHVDERGHHVRRPGPRGRSPGRW